MEQRFEKIVLNVPHASYEDAHVEEWSDRQAFVRELFRWTDWYTDWIFGSEDPRVDMCRLPMSRFACDVERLLDDPLEQEGRGIVYTRFNGLTRKPLTAELYERTMAVYHAYHALLGSKVTKGSLLIDCHSFPGELASDIDICIGYNEDASKPSPEVLALVKAHFEQAGYRVAYNQPYGNSITPATGFVYPSLMIEINKRCYLNEPILPVVDLDKACDLRKVINTLYEKLLR